MAVPKRKTSKSRRNKRRSHHRIRQANIIEDKKTGEIIAEKDTKITKEVYDLLKNHKIKSIPKLKEGREYKVSIELLQNSMEKDPTSNREEALKLLYQHLRAGEAPTTDIAKKFIEKMFFSTKKYDLGAVGRYRINKKFGLNAPTSEPVLTRDDFVEVFKYLIEMDYFIRNTE